MIKLKLKILIKNSQGQRYSEDIELDDHFNICKDNEKLQKIVHRVMEASNIQEIDDVIVSSKCKW